MVAKTMFNEELRINSSFNIQTSQRSENNSTFNTQHSTFKF